MLQNETTYLGDGVYAQFDGYHIWLLVGSHDYPTDKVAIEPEVFLALTSFAKKVGMAPREDNI